MTVTCDLGVTTPVIPVDPESADRTAETARRILPVAGGHMDDPQWIAAARDAWSELPVGLRRALLDFRRASGPTGSALVRGLPVHEPALPPTPSVKGSVQRSATVPAAVLMMIAAGLGDPAAFRPEKSGALVQDVVPVPGQEDFQGNAGSVLLSFHNENAFHPHRPDFVMLLCLRADHDRVAGLRTGCIRQALPLLSEESREALSLPEFVTAAPPSFGSGSGGTTPHPVLFGAPEDPDVRVDFAATEPLTPCAGRAMDALQAAFGRTARTALLEPGDLAIVDNRVTVHGRTAFTPRYDGRDRWLQRSFILTDLRRSRGCRDADGYVLD
ncbi:clavaminate synthase family protein [Streptomyces sp. NBC_01525]|uniref:L-asparagine oxygenase n=1 Tax=Streptomyces benahoarensis TaxID=2595054 RepID=A0A553ZQC0_9ACTN|nr:clavaminate synthase family protein [Streptomyces benahoarensis]TSB31519.1 L-asparagine oxygenase [Streptomyces benahoarensis]TSB43657.1 L-asparagine oxygenase [Streptomyces benahoarensis]